MTTLISDVELTVFGGPDVVDLSLDFGEQGTAYFVWHSKEIMTTYSLSTLTVSGNQNGSLICLIDQNQLLVAH